MEVKFRTKLRENGRSITRARLLLFQYFERHGLITPKQFIADNQGIADQANLYRTLAMFKNLGIVEERIAGGKHVLELTDSYNSHHHHLTCTKCGMSVPVTVPSMEGQLKTIGKQHGFTIEKHVIELEGLCSDCQNK